MKFFAKLMIAALFIAIALPFTVLKNDEGDSLLSFSDLSLPDISLPDFDLPSFSDFGDKLPSVDGLEGKDIVYQWRDAEGNVQFSSEPPAEGIEYQVKGYDPNANVIQSVKLPKPGAETENVVIDIDGDAQPQNGGVDSPYSPEAIEKLFDDTKNLEKALNQRFEAQESALNQ